MEILIFLFLIFGFFSFISGLSKPNVKEKSKPIDTPHNSQNIPSISKANIDNHIKDKSIKSEHIVPNKNKTLLETDTGIPDDFEFNDEFKQAFNLMENSSQNLFITGKAGTGKSTLLQYFRKNTKKNIVVLAPTGVAAVKVRGQTIHSFFKFPPKAIQKKHIKRLRDSTVVEKLDAIVIDEVSMVRSDIMDGIDYALRVNRGEYNLPFGGVQVILFGDLFQLSPVVGYQERKIIESQYQSPYFFSAKVWENSKLVKYELNKVYRQKDNEFIEILNKVRMDECEEDELKKINQRVVKNIEHDSKGIVTLTTTNKDAANINIECLSKIKAKEFNYTAIIKGDFDEKLYPTDLCLKLKQGAQVMLLRNDGDKRWVNGTLAEISILTQESIEVNIKGETFRVDKERWEKIEYYFNKKDNKIEEKVLGYFEQYPLMLAWAVTIHKSQGQNFKDVVIDMGNGAFAHGQTYVALSRCTSLEGIKLVKPIIFSDIIFDKRIYQFLGIPLKKKQNATNQKQPSKSSDAQKVKEEKIEKKTQKNKPLNGIIKVVPDNESTAWTKISEYNSNEWQEIFSISAFKTIEDIVERYSFLFYGFLVRMGADKEGILGEATRDGKMRIILNDGTLGSLFIKDLYFKSKDLKSFIEKVKLKIENAGSGDYNHTTPLINEKVIIECNFTGSLISNDACSYDIYVRNSDAKKLVFNINHWTYSKVRSRSAYRKMKQVLDNKLQLSIEGQGYDNRCRWCRTFRTGLATACEKRFGKGSFLQDVYCQYE
ncbi:MAG: AAA family ATPase [Candidatus Omnitrophica bacterium]|nr:AAA family ATPase [Candidatus Omnitrophota bacterium]